jgi:hypothetical protein
MTEIFKTSTGQQYEIEIDDFGEEITVFKGGQKCGSISLKLFEGEERSGIPDSYKIIDLALGVAKGQGVGRRCLELHKEMFNAPLTAGRDEGSRSEDGSHLIDDGPGFIKRMRELGLVCRENNYDDRFDDE